MVQPTLTAPEYRVLWFRVEHHTIKVEEDCFQNGFLHLHANFGAKIQLFYDFFAYFPI